MNKKFLQMSLTAFMLITPKIGQCVSTDCSTFPPGEWTENCNTQEFGATYTPYKGGCILKTYCYNGWLQSKNQQIVVKSYSSTGPVPSICSYRYNTNVGGYNDGHLCFCYDKNNKPNPSCNHD